MEPVARASGFRERAPRPHLPRFALMTTGMVFLALVIVLPMVSMFQYASGHGFTVFWESISSPGALFSLRFSITLALATTLINGALGTLVAFMLVRYDFPLKGLVDSLIDLPVAIPASVTGLTILLLYGPMGILGKVFEGAGITITFAFPAILIAHVFMTLPFVVRAVGPVLVEVDAREQEAARILGASQFQVFTSVILPSIKGGLIAGCVLTFVRSLGELGATIFVSGNLALQTQTAPLFIFSEFSKGNIAAANSMAVLLVIISLVLFTGFNLSTKLKERK